MQSDPTGAVDTAFEAEVTELLRQEKAAAEFDHLYEVMDDWSVVDLVWLFLTMVESAPQKAALAQLCTKAGLLGQFADAFDLYINGSAPDRFNDGRKEA